MQSRIVFFFLLVASLCFSRYAYAGDGATIILKSGAVLYMNNGYQQVVDGLKTFNQRGDYNYYLLVNIADAPFYINLGSVEMICRDRCRSVEITLPPKKEAGTKEKE